MTGGHAPATTEARRKFLAILRRRPEWTRTKQGEPTADDHEDLAHRRKQQLWRRQECRLGGEAAARHLTAMGDYCAEIRLYCPARGRVFLVARRDGARRVVAEGARTLFGYRFEAALELFEPGERHYLESEQPLERGAHCAYQSLYLEWDLRHALLTAGREWAPAQRAPIPRRKSRRSASSP